MIKIVSDEGLILEQQLSFILYACSKETIRRYRTYLDLIGLTYTQYITMLVLWNKDNITIKELGKRLYLDSGTITPIIKKLETKELVERFKHTNNSKNVLVKVTSKGYKLREKVKAFPKKILGDTGVPIEEAQLILEILEYVLERLNYECY